MASIEQRVKDIIVEQLGVEEDEVSPEASFIDDLGADSLDTVELVMAFEEEFNIEIPDEDAEGISTVAGCHRLHQDECEGGIISCTMDDRDRGASEATKLRSSPQRF